MRRTRTMVTVAVLFGLWASWCAAAETRPAPSPQATPKASAEDNAALRAEYQRTLAAWKEARSAEQPDEAKIAQLQHSLRQLRRQLCPQGGSGLGNGGPGYGFGYGRGRGWGPGCGPGNGGVGCGRGPGYGRGYGPGGGQGRAPGGPAFVDRDNDGVCDHHQQRRAAAQ